MELPKFTPTKLSCVRETLQTNIKFENLSYFVKEKKSKKYVLNDISGQFYSGEITAILGASGSGKTTLLNILAGYVSKNVSGSLTINEEVCDVKCLRKLSAYIMQNDLIQPHLTLEEEMLIAAKLRLPGTSNEQQLRVEELIDVFKLRDCCKQRVEKLSGGERKRLAIALELLSNPSIILIDEPTSGLDSVNTTLCIDILKELANFGKTIICTIHQPTVSVMNQFHQVYFLAQGACVYNGSTKNILPFLISINLECPVTYSYSEFIIETIDMNPAIMPTFSNAIQNGERNLRHLDNKLIQFRNKTLSEIDNCRKYRPSFWTQFTIIFNRMMLQQMRNKVGLISQIFTHTIIGFMYGLAFLGVGSNAKYINANVYYCWLATMFFLYNSVMNYILSYPFELEIVRKEYLNGWYDFKAYFLAVSFRGLPIMVTLGLGCIVVSYLLSAQPLEFYRFFRFACTSLMVGIITDGLGLAIGCSFSPLTGSVFGPSFLAPIAILPLYGIGYGDAVTLSMEIVMRFSYMRYAMIASLYALMDGRSPLPCPDDAFCYYKDPKHVLYKLGLLNKSYYLEMLGLVCFLFIFRALAYFLLKRKMREELTGKNSDYVAQILRLQS